jgi:glyoxylase-like metal-dependent hydrolase (beta-lactamase superfamily II)
MRKAGVIAVLVALSVPTITRTQDKATQNAKTTQDVTAMVDAALGALGVLRGTERQDSLVRAHFTATGTMGALGQPWRPEMPWPLFTLTNFKAGISYTNPIAMRLEIERTNPDGVVQGGGGLPLAAPQKLIQVIADKYAWNETQPGVNPTPAQAAYYDRLLQFWMLTPHAAIKAARIGGISTRITSERGATVLTFPVPGLPANTIKATLNAQHLVDRLETRFDNPVLGDTIFETTFSEYRDIDAARNSPSDILFPARIVQKQGGHLVLDLTITHTNTYNPYIVFPILENVEKAAAQPPAPVRVEAQKVADGVWYLTGGTHHSVAVEFRDYVAVVEGPLHEARASAVIETVRKTIPNKPIRYVINTHHHFDHSGGLRPFVAEGTTILTQALNKPYYERVWANPHTINPDRLAKAPRRPAIEAVTDKRVLGDGRRSLELYRLQGSNHADTMLVAYLPKERMLIEADVYTPPAATAPPPTAVNAEAANLYANLERLKLNVAQILPLHGRQMSISDLRAAGGRATN